MKISALRKEIESLRSDINEWLDLIRDRLLILLFLATIGVWGIPEEHLSLRTLTLLGIFVCAIWFLKLKAQKRSFPKRKEKILADIQKVHAEAVAAQQTDCESDYRELCEELDRTVAPLQLRRAKGDLLFFYFSLGYWALTFQLSVYSVDHRFLPRFGHALAAESKLFFIQHR